MQNICESTRTGSKIMEAGNEVANAVGREAANAVVGCYEMEWLVVVWLHRFRLRNPQVDSGNQVKVGGSERISSVVVRCDSCIESVMIVAALETTMNAQ